MKIKLLFFFAILITLTACDKNKKRSERISGTWKVSELTIDENQVIADLPILKIRQSDIYEEVNTGEWTASYGDTCQFYWQFTDKGKHFTFARIENDHFTGESIPESDKDVFDYSGTYDVITHDKDEFVFESKQTLKFSGKKVRLILRRK